MISIVIPTVTGREDFFERCVYAYEHNTANPIELIVYKDLPTCGRGWIKGAEDATGEYVHFTADDLEPALGWDVAAIEAVDKGIWPIAAINRDTTALMATDWQPTDARNTVPFLNRPMLEAALPLLDAHYYTDDWVDYRVRMAGYPGAYRTGYRFTHYRADYKRGAGMTEPERMDYDRRIYEQAKATLGP